MTQVRDSTLIANILLNTELRIQAILRIPAG
jgi:hypothetical protein